MEKYKIVAIGAGFGGLQAVTHAALRGARCAVIDKLGVGGECLNFGCIPTKSMVRSIETYNLVRNSSQMGVTVQGSVDIDFSKVIARKNEVIRGIANRGYKGLQAIKVDYYSGVGTILNPNSVRVSLNDAPSGQSGTVTIEAENIVIGTGSSPDRPPIPGADLPGVLTNREIMDLEKQPQSMVVLGCSYVGIELGTIFASMGTRVTMLGRKSFLKDSDQKLADMLRQRIANNLNVPIETGLNFQEIQQTDGNLYRVVYEKDGWQKSAEGEVVLAATGRTPYMEELFGDGLKIDMNGPAIAVNEHLETSVPGIYAVGDVLNGVMLAFSAATEGEVVADNCLGKKSSVDYSVIPTCVFTDLELAGVGLREEEAQSVKGLEFGVSEYPFSTTPMAEIMNRTEGLTRLVYEKGSGKILGGHILGPHASELIAEMALAVHQGVTVKELAYLFHFHPSLAENVQRVAKSGWLMTEMKK